MLEFMKEYICTRCKSRYLSYMSEIPYEERICDGHKCWHMYKHPEDYNNR